MLSDFHSNYIGACAGQFLDASLAKLPRATVDDAILMTSLKSGSLGRFSAAFGAGVATEDPEIITLCGDFGFDLFTYLQLVDDLRDGCPASGVPRDLIQRKQTVPLVYFYNYLEERYGDSSHDIIHHPGINEASTEIRLQYRDSGADLFCAIVAETFLNRAKMNLRELTSRLGRTERLERFVRSLEISPQELLAAA